MSRLSAKTQGIIFIFCAALSFAGMNLFVRLAGDLPTMQKAFFRNFFAAIIAAFLFFRSKTGVKGMTPSKVLHLFLRCAAGTAGTAGNTAAAGVPKVTKSPTGETVNAGGNAWFVAKYQNAVWAEWHFVNPDGTTDLSYTDAAWTFPTLTIVGGDQSTMQLKNIPAELNGWKVYCVFRNNVGSANTAPATVTVVGAPAVQPVQPAQPAQGGTILTPGQGFEGRWAGEIAGRCQLTMSYYAEGSVKVDISWSSSAWERSRWQMTANVYRNDIMIYEDGHSWVETYTDDTHYTVSDESIGGTGSFYIEDGKLHWVDNSTGENVTFIPA